MLSKYWSRFAFILVHSSILVDWRQCVETCKENENFVLTKQDGPCIGTTNIPSWLPVRKLRFGTVIWFHEVVSSLNF